MLTFSSHHAKKTCKFYNKGYSGENTDEIFVSLFISL
jgi:hypothetical protein